ncbi:MAG: polyprenol monophosphomannose synthase [Candidatus Omnitrophica bacterium]|nr:polyprenol monophosphomannose synthase [Candidatus Omnitrophota bacterium]
MVWAELRTAELSETAKIWVIVPTYNEAENIQKLLRAILSLDLDLQVLVVDDQSPDGTADLIDSMDDPRARVLRRTGERGYGHAVLDGFRTALSEGAELIVGMDADFSHDPSAIPALVEGTQNADVVIGSRYCADGGTINWPVYRMALSRFANHYVRSILRIPVTDSTSGFRCYRREIVEKLDLDEIRSEGYSFLVELLYRSWLVGARIVEKPILFRDRLLGKSKINSKEIYRSIFMVLWLKVSLHRKG